VHHPGGRIIVHNCLLLGLPTDFAARANCNVAQVAGEVPADLVQYVRVAEASAVVISILANKFGNW